MKSNISFIDSLSQYLHLLRSRWRSRGSYAGACTTATKKARDTITKIGTGPISDTLKASLIVSRRKLEEKFSKYEEAHFKIQELENVNDAQGIADYNTRSATNDKILEEIETLLLRAEAKSGEESRQVWSEAQGTAGVAA